jgi:cob(I)alamin adenosyltransferase
MSIYTRKGDAGTTSFGTTGVDKDDQGIEVCGNIDELSALLGVVRTEGLPAQFETVILRVQQELIDFCAEIVFDFVTISPEHIRQIESDIDHISSELPPLTQFVISGGNRVSAVLHLARTVCRRAERRFVTLCRTKQKSLHIVAYLNRFSDLLFVMARKVDEKAE